MFKAVEKWVAGEKPMVPSRESSSEIPVPQACLWAGVLRDDGWADADRRGRSDGVGEIEGFPWHHRNTGQSIGGDGPAAPGIYLWHQPCRIAAPRRCPGLGLERNWPMSSLSCILNTRRHFPSLWAKGVSVLISNY